jgi:protein phosphatase
MILTAWAGATDKGPHREINEDSFLAAPPVFVVADGMGGHAAGDLASQLAIGVFQGLTGGVSLTVDEATDALAQANQAILEAVRQDPGRAGMGTTVAGLVVVVAGGSEHWMVFNVGDSRVYRLVHGDLRQVTVDHSEAEELIAAGRLSREAARNYQRRNIVTRSLGSDPPAAVDSWVFPPDASDRFIICSDGLTTELRDSEISDIATMYSDPHLVAEKLVEKALEAGGHDNVTVVVVDGGSGSADEIDDTTAPRPLRIPESGHD